MPKRFVVFFKTKPLEFKVFFPRISTLLIVSPLNCNCFPEIPRTIFEVFFLTWLTYFVDISALALVISLPVSKCSLVFSLHIFMVAKFPFCTSLCTCVDNVFLLDLFSFKHLYFTQQWELLCPIFQQTKYFKQNESEGFGTETIILATVNFTVDLVTVVVDAAATYHRS